MHGGEWVTELRPAADCAQKNVHEKGDFLNLPACEAFRARAGFWQKLLDSVLIARFGTAGAS
jgi:hypothetical protein